MTISEIIQTYRALGLDTLLNFGQYTKHLQNEIAKEKDFKTIEWKL
ncbi:hypothetical protein JMN10_00015 [Capnocytophaga genosp. AHN8471]|jgi:hypothetical protein|uniref:Uncharacterized protein n=1 Tax=Capnocytophaga genosp. AHN8471 TaxID=327574 RepID=A0ABS1Z0S2_9FLAO|nr:hypothetical protein [Capnocytophaga genosp. AHN8471]MBM0651845.1 hypothetical protein [Capnocytophaga genosp. AHN8471]MBM0660581.1 hypothetical protein [Capnocytophaga genosp. AHN8471]